MTGLITVSLPYPPSVNNLYSNVAGKGRRPTSRYATWQRAAQTEVMAQRSKFKVPRIAGKVQISIVLERRRNGMDIDNCAKAIIDTLVKMNLIDDDRHVERLSLEWGDVTGARVDVMPVAEMAVAGR